MSDPFKFTSLDKLKSLASPIVAVITEGLLQVIAEDDCGGRLNDKELEEFDHASQEWCFDELFDWVCKTIAVCRANAEQVSESDRRIEQLAKQRKSTFEIAGALNLSESYVSKWLQERYPLGLI
jgi:hypothetical protein